MKEFETIQGTDPGSVFFVIAQGLGFKIGVRFWVHELKMHHVKVGFRVRLVAENLEVVPVNFMQVATQLFPKANWTGGGKAHSSVAGMLAITFKDEAMIPDIVKQEAMATKLLGTIKEVFAGMDYSVSDEDFTELLVSLTMDGIALYAASLPAQGAVIDFKPKGGGALVLDKSPEGLENGNGGPSLASLVGFVTGGAGGEVVDPLTMDNTLEGVSTVVPESKADTAFEVQEPPKASA